MSHPLVTIVVVPRERFSHSERSLANIYENTSCPFKLTYVSAGAPAPIVRHLERESEEKGFHLIRVPRYLSPNTARNLALREIDTKYVVFLDNDALVMPGWLEALVQCAEETGAWVAGPVYYIGEFEQGIVHMAGGTVHIEEREGKRILYEEQYHLNTRRAEVRAPLRRQKCGHLEFHCILARTNVFERLGPLDEELLSVHEHIDFCMAVRKAGGSVFLEPGAVTTYIPPPPCKWWDLPFFMLRWSDEWNFSTARRFNEKWGVSCVLHVSDKSNATLEDTIIRFARGHRRLMTGLQVSDKDDDRPESPLEHAELMLAIFQSVDRDRFDLALTADDGSVLQAASGLGPQAVLERLPAALQDGAAKNLNVILRPVSQERLYEPALLRLDNLDSKQLRSVRPYALLTLETEPQRYQCWLAVDKGNWRSAAALRRLGPRKGASNDGYSHLAGSINVSANSRGPGGGSYRVKLVEASTGLLNTTGQLETKGVLPYLAHSQIY
jgi:GT2 family glycosyltransferase